MNQYRSTEEFVTWVDTATDATLIDLLREACASFDEGISISGSDHGIPRSP